MKKAEKLARQLFSDKDLQAIAAAVKSFEKLTSGEIVISFNTTSHKQPYKMARRIFQKAGLYQTKERNATLIVLYLAEQKFAVFGDAGIHAKVPANFWETTVADMKADFAQGRMLAGLLHGIQELGENLAKYFPVAADDVNELSDEIKFGEGDHD